MAEPIPLPETFANGFVVGNRESFRLLGTVLGDVEVLHGGSLIHEGHIDGTLIVRDGGSVYIHGMQSDVVLEDGATVELHGHGPVTPAMLETAGLPIDGPEGWDELTTEWAQAVLGIDDVVGLASLEDYVKARGEDTTEDALRAVAAAIAVTDRSDDARMWALLSAAVFNGVFELRARRIDPSTGAPPELCSPQDCRERLPWAELERYFDAPPPLFSQLAGRSNRAGVSLAYAYYLAIWPLVSAALSLGDPPSPEVMERVEAWRMMLLGEAVSDGEAAADQDKPGWQQTLEDIAEGKRTRPVAGTTKGKPKPKGGTKGRGKRPKTKAAGEHKPPQRRRQSKAAPKKPLGPTDTTTNPVDSALVELESLIGLGEVKKQVRELASYARISQYRQARGMRASPATRHLVMTGNPGTGKTTVARLLGQIYYGYGLLRRNAMLAVTRSNLVGQWQGHTAEKVDEVFRDALGGVLFIDEAYALSTGKQDNFGQEAIDALVPRMEDHRDDIVVIVAGYPDKMKAFLRETNPGFRGRFGRTIEFVDFSDAELLEIVRLECAKSDMRMTKAAERKCKPLFAAGRERLGQEFSNGRYARLVFEAARDRHHARVDKLMSAEKRELTDDELRDVLPADIPPPSAMGGDEAKRSKRMGFGADI
jgi:AAA+ superfamily predicted ATPase